MNLLNLFARAELQYGASEREFFSGIILLLLNESATFTFIEESIELKKHIHSLLENTTPQLYEKAKSEQAGAITEWKKHLAILCKKQQHILSCPQIDEHVLLLACLKGLEKYLPGFYKTVLKEILTKQLHKMQQTEHASHIVGRKRELQDIANILSRSTKNSVLLVGPSGVGKTTLALGMQEKLTDKTLMRIFPGSDIFFDQVITIISNSEKQVLFFLDELSTFDMSQVQYLLENSQVVATVNNTSFKKLASDYPHIISKCEIVELDEPTAEDLTHIFVDKIQELQEEYAIPFEDGIVEETTNLAKQYIHEPVFPAKGLSLLEEAVIAAKQQSTTVVSKNFIRVLVSQKTNIPIGSLTEFEKKDLASLPLKLTTRVKGQNEAITKVALTIQRSRIGFKKPNKPIGSFLFIGPSGVGKTELAKALAKEVFGDEDAMIRLDMSEFAEAHMVQRLIGSPPGYIGFEEGGQLTNPIKSRPYSLILLDEIEKAHPRVFDIFLQILDDGRLTDGQGKIVDFRNTIIIATSNAGIEDMLDMIAEGKTHVEIEKELKEVLSDYFRLEFINRFDGVILFDPLTIEALESIAKIQIDKLQTELNKKHITLTVSDSTIARLANNAYDPRFGARELLRLLQDTIENKLAEMLIHGELQEGQTVAF